MSIQCPARATASFQQHPAGDEPSATEVDVFLEEQRRTLHDERATEIDSPAARLTRLVNEHLAGRIAAQEYSTLRREILSAL